MTLEEYNIAAFIFTCVMTAVLLVIGGIVGYYIRENQIKRSDNRKLAKKIKKFIHKYEKL